MDIINKLNITEYLLKQNDKNIIAMNSKEYPVTIQKLINDDFSLFKNIIQFKFDDIQNKRDKLKLSFEEIMYCYQFIDNPMNQPKTKYFKYEQIIHPWLREQNFFELTFKQKPEITETTNTITPKEETIINEEPEIPNIDNANTEKSTKTKKTGKNKKKQPKPNYTEYPLSSFTDPISTGINQTNTTPTQTKEFKYPYYTPETTLYCKSASFTGKYLLITRDETNQGTVQIANGQFSVSSGIYVIKLQEEYETYFDDIKSQLENDFNYEELIKENPVKVLVKGKEQLSKLIGKSHLENFMIKIINE